MKVVLEQLIIRGQNFRVQVQSYLKVTVNNKEAAIVGASDDIIYAIVQLVRIPGMYVCFVGKGDDVEEYASSD